MAEHGSFFLSFFALFFDFAPATLCWIFAILFVALLSTFHSVAIGASLLFFIKLAAGLLAVFCAYSFGKKEGMVEVFCLVFILGGLGVCAMAYFFWLNSSPLFPYLTGTFYQSDVFGGYLLLLIPLSASLAVFSAGRVRRLLYGATTFFFILTLFLTFSRGAMLVFCLIAVLWGYFVYRANPSFMKRGLLLFALVFLFAIGCVIFAHKGLPFRNFSAKILNSGSWSITTGARWSFWKGALKIFWSHLWLGSGPDTFGRLFPLYQEKFFWYSRFPHNFYLQILSDQGVVSLILNIGFVLLILVSGWRALRLNDVTSPFIFGLFFGFLGGALHLFLDVDSNFVAWQILFYAEGGLLLAAGSFAGEENPGSYFTKRSLRWVLSIMLVVLLGVQVSAEAASLLDYHALQQEAREKSEQALGQEEQALAFFPLLADYWGHKAHFDLDLYSRTGKKNYLLEAQDALDKAILLDPRKPIYFGELAGIESSFPSRRKEALALLVRALTVDPLNFPEHYIKLADLEVDWGKISKATQIYESVILLYPENDIAQLEFFRKDDFVTAVGAAHLGLAKLAISKGNMHGAALEVGKAARLTKESPQVAYYSGILAMYGKDWDKAGQAFQYAIYDPALAYDSWKWFSLARLRSGQLKEALDAVRHAFQIRSPDASLDAIAGDIYSRNGNGREALRLWAQGLKLDPRNRLLPRKMQLHFSQNAIFGQTLRRQ